jgi:hypothetical protein
VSWVENYTGGWRVVTGDTYTYSVKDPLLDRERYIRAALMDLHSPSQHHVILAKGKTEITNRMATTVETIGQREC